MSDLATRFHAARTNPGLAVLEGFHAIKHAIRFGADIQAIVTRDPSGLAALATRLAPDVAPAFGAVSVTVDEVLFSELSPTPPETGVIAIAVRRISTPAEIAALPDPAPMVLLESPSHSGNIGAAIRVAAGAGASALLTTGTIDPWNPAALRGSAGLHYALPVLRVDAFQFGGRQLIAIDPEGDHMQPHGIPENAILAFGSERAGLSAELLGEAVRRVRIPMRQGVSSLNLATAVGIVLYTWKLQR